MLGDAELRSLAARVASSSADSTQYNDQLQDLLGRFRELLRDYSDLRDRLEVAEKTAEYKKQAVRQAGVQRNEFKRETNQKAGQTFVCTGAFGRRWLHCELVTKVLLTIQFNFKIATYKLKAKEELMQPTSSVTRFVT